MRGLLKRINTLWYRLLFEPVSPAPVCVFRILFGFLILLSYLLLYSDLSVWFGSNGMVSLQTAKAYTAFDRFSVFFFLPDTDASVFVVYSAVLLSAFAVMIGFRTRLSLIVLFLCLLSFNHRNPAIFHSGDSFLRVSCFLLIFAPCGKMFSFDSRHCAYPEQWKILCSPFAQRLLQWQIAAIYCQTFSAKIQGETWRNGTAVYYTSHLEEFQKLPVPYLFDHLWTCQLLTWSTLAIECALWTLIWFKGCRYYVLLAGVLMHLGIDWSMNIPIFEYAMIVSFVNFVSPDHIKLVLDSIGQRFGRTPPMSTEQVSTDH